MRPVPLKCPSCGSGLSKEDIDFDQWLATCRHCHTLMSLSVPEPVDSGRTGPRAPVPVPAKYTVSHGVHALEISWRWFTPAILFLVFFCIAWDGFLVFWYGIAFSTNAPWIMKVFPIVHVAVGVGLTYLTLATLVNTTRLTVTNHELSVRHGPLPWAGSKTVRIGSLQQLFVKENSRTNKGHTTHTYSVCAVGADGRHVDLVKNLPERDQALWLEQEIERYTGIADEPVAGEVSR